MESQRIFEGFKSPALAGGGGFPLQQQAASNVLLASAGAAVIGRFADKKRRFGFSAGF